MTETDSKILAKSWIKRLHDAQMGHYNSSERQYRIAHVSGVTLITFTALLSLFTFYEPETGFLCAWLTSYWYKVVCIVMSGVSAILSSVLTFYRPSERAEVHRSQAAKYGAMRREIELALTCSEDKLAKTLEATKKWWDEVASDSPLTYLSTIRRIKKIQRKMENA